VHPQSKLVLLNLSTSPNRLSVSSTASDLIFAGYNNRMYNAPAWALVAKNAFERRIYGTCSSCYTFRL